VAFGPPAANRHLRNLQANDRIEKVHPAFDARVRIYTLRPEQMANLKSWIEETEQRWVAQLTAIKTRPEREP